MFPVISIGDTNIPVYLTLISFFYSVAIFWALARARKFDMDRQLCLDLCLILMVGGFVGARLLHILYEEPAYYWENPSAVFKFWQGGFVFYGGALGAFLSAFVFVRWKRSPWLEWADFFAPIVALGYSIGRVACFLNGCCYGKVCELPWAVQFTHGAGTGLYRHPTQLYATLWELGVFATLLFLERKRQSGSTRRIPAGLVFATWVGLHSVGRFIMEIFRDDFRGENLLGMSVSMWISLGLIATSATLFIKLKIKPPISS